MKTVAEFFAGIGLMRLGLERAGWETVWANDMDADKLEIYRGHFPDAFSFIIQNSTLKIRCSAILDREAAPLRGWLPQT